jgi:uncharacterized membrane protein
LTDWSYKHWGALVGAILVILGVTLGPGITAIIILFSLGGYLVGRFLDGELDLQELQERVQQRRNRL